jgi:uncharacterized membrane protein
MNRQTRGIVLAGSIASALAAATLSASAAPPEGKESCYGVSLKGHNDCAAGAHSCAGQAAKSYDKADFKYVPVGTCVKMHPHGHMGTLSPA